MVPVPTSQTIINAESELEIHRVTLNWDIKHFDRICPPESLNFVAFTSSVFRADGPICQASAFSEWAVTVDNEDGYLQIWCHLENMLSESETEVQALISMAILKPDKSEAWHRSCSKSHVFRPGTDDNGWGLSNIIRLQKLWEDRNEFLVDNTLRLKVTLDLYGDMTYRRIKMLSAAKRRREECEHHEESPDLQSESLLVLQKDLFELLDSQKDSDFTIQCGQKLFPVHKLIIGARSNVFAAMLEHDTLEVQTGVVKIDDVTDEIMGHVVEYMYTGTTNFSVNTSILMSLLQAADKYELTQLKNVCFLKLCDQLSLNNVGTLAVLAYLHNAEQDVVDEIHDYFERHWDTLRKNQSFIECITAHPAAFFITPRSVDDVENCEAVSDCETLP